MGRAERSAARAAARAAEPAGTPGAPDEETEIPELKDEENPAEDRLSAIPEENSTTASEKPAAALTLVEQVARIKEQLGIEATTLPDAVQQANTVMGLAGGGALPAQVEALAVFLIDLREFFPRRELKIRGLLRRGGAPIGADCCHLDWAHSRQRS